MLFANRADAGGQLARRLEHLRGQSVVVLGLPRGGVPVAAQVARALDAPLDVIVVRKIGVPFQPELAMGAVGEHGVRVTDRQVIRAGAIKAEEFAAAEAREQAAVSARAARYRSYRPREPLSGRVAVVVDDGIATGSTARAACQVARAYGAARVVLAVPVAPRGWEARIGLDADELVCVQTPADFYAIGQFYADFAQLTDEDVIACLDLAARRQAALAGPRPRGDRSGRPAQHIGDGSPLGHGRARESDQEQDNTATGGSDYASACSPPLRARPVPGRARLA
jgi:putative phosphoribosyl transferase